MGTDIYSKFSSILNNYDVPQVTPFTHRDGATYLEILRELTEYINGTLTDSIDREFSDFTIQIDSIFTEYNAALQKLTTDYSAVDGKILRKFAELYSRFDSLKQIIFNELSKQHDSVSVFNWYSSVIEDIGRVLFDIHNIQNTSAVCCYDFEKYRINVEDVENVESISVLETDSRKEFRETSGLYAFSPINGAYMHRDNVARSMFGVSDNNSIISIMETKTITEIGE